VKRKNLDESVTIGGGNVFDDLGFGSQEAAELKVKAQLALRIQERIKELALTQVRAAGRLGVSQPEVSKLMNGRHTRFSVDKLMALLNALEVDIDIVVRPRHHGRTIRPGVMRVTVGVA
jgi:predicted XRE-type DNA-binding protein